MKGSHVEQSRASDGAACSIVPLFVPSVMVPAVSQNEHGGLEAAYEASGERYQKFYKHRAVDPQAGTGVYSADAVNIQTQILIVESVALRQPVIDRLQRDTRPVLPPQSDLLAKVRKSFT